MAGDEASRGGAMTQSLNRLSHRRDHAWAREAWERVVDHEGRVVQRPRRGVSGPVDEPSSGDGVAATLTERRWPWSTTKTTQSVR
jgi:hypothetical protein